MPRFGSLISRLARQLAADSRVRDKASEVYNREVRPRAKSLYENEVKPRAKDLYEGELKPRAQTAWRDSKPKLDAARSELKDIARETDPRKDPRKFARKLKERFIDRKD